MFLKRIELQGFKSFADKTILTFDSDVIGIVPMAAARATSTMRFAGYWENKASRACVETV